MSLLNKTIILGITGGIAAYKTVDLVSQLKKLGADVHVIMTEKASQFVSELSLQVMSGNKVHVQQESLEIDHINLADKADLVLIAPATANSIAKLTFGMSDGILYDTVLATKAPVLIAPAMNTNMWDHATTRRNLEILVNDLNYEIIQPDSGELACGHIGPGRLPELGKLTEKIEQVLAKNQKLSGKKIVITVGPSREQIDPIRFISNHSSGKMGFALAEEAIKQGAEVILITSLDNNAAWIEKTKLIKVSSADEMLEAVDREFAQADVLIMVAAVADYKAKIISDQKIKKGSENLVIELEKTEDILQHVSQNKRAGQVVIGFSVETENLLANSRAKLKNKNLDLLVANSTDAFNADSAEVILFTRDSEEKLDLSKADLAIAILKKLENNQVLKV